MDIWVFSAFIMVAKSRVLEIVSLLEISSVYGLISSMNYSILKAEFSNLLKSVNKSGISHDASSHNLLTKDFFNISIPESHISDETIASMRLPKVADPKTTTDYIKDKIRDKNVFNRTIVKT